MIPSLHRIARALGPEPLEEDARHLLAPLPPLPEPPRAANGPQPAREFVIDLAGTGTLEAGRVRQFLPPERRAALDFPHLWGRPVGRNGWVPLDQADPTLALDSVALSWDLSALFSEDIVDVARDLGAYVAATGHLASALNRTVSPREEPERAARRAADLRTLRERFGRSVEMLLLPTGRPLPSRAIWRAAYALGLEWGDLNLFHWYDPHTDRRLFTLSALGKPGYFLPERAAEGEGVVGIALGFELPPCPAPLEVYDRMAIALAYLRQRLGGRPATPDGAELDAERLDAHREALAEAVVEMARAGLAPGSPEAARFF